MSKQRKSTNNISSILSSIVLVLLVVFVVGFLFVYTDNLKTPLKNFYVTCGHDKIISDRENFDIIMNKEYKFEITTNIDIDGTNNKYIVSVVPNETNKTAFAYEIDGAQCNYAELENLTKGFSIVANENYFSFKATKDLLEILQLYHPAKTISNVPTALDSDLPYFRLVVQSADQTETININFNIKSE